MECWVWYQEFWLAKNDEPICCKRFDVAQESGKKTRCYQVNDGGLNPTSDQTLRRYTLTKSFQRLQNGPVSPSSANIACVDSTERLSQYFSARPEYHLVANWWQVWSEIVAPWLWVVLFSQFEIERKQWIARTELKYEKEEQLSQLTGSRL